VPASLDAQAFERWLPTPQESDHLAFLTCHVGGANVLRRVLAQTGGRVACIAASVVPEMLAEITNLVIALC
jgi:hypothetical protein